MPIIAQEAPSRITPESIAPPTNPEKPSFDIRESRYSSAPQGSENLSVKVADVVVENADPRFAGAIGAITAAAKGQTRTVGELYAMAAAIEALYARHGLILARATVPPQQLSDGGTFRIVMVDGFIESVDASKVPARVRDVMSRRLSALVGAKGLSLREIERRVLLAGRVPGVSLTTTLVPGEQPGGARLVLTVDHRPVGFGVATNNDLGDAYGNWSFDARASLNSLFGQGEQIFALASTTSDFNLFSGRPMRRYAGGGIVLPIGVDGFTLTADYLHADTNPKPPADGVPIAGKLNRVTVIAAWPAILRRRESLNLALGFIMVNEDQTVTGFGARLSDDRLRYVNAGADWQKALSDKVTITAGAQFSQGIDGLGARNQADALRTGVLLSRQGSRPDFTVISGNLGLAHKLGRRLEGRLALRGQQSLSNALPSAAQFALDGGDGLSGYSLGSISTDSGFTARYELGSQLNLASGLSAFPYAFGAAGWGRFYQSTVLEQRHPDGWSLGGGVRAAIAERLALSAELSRSHSNVFPHNQTRLLVSASIQF